MVKEPKDTHLTLRVSKRRKSEVEDIASKEHRSVNNAADLLLVKGIVAYRADGVLRPDDGALRQLSQAEAAGMDKAVAKHDQNKPVESKKRRPPNAA